MVSLVKLQKESDVEHSKDRTALRIAHDAAMDLERQKRELAMEAMRQEVAAEAQAGARRVDAWRLACEPLRHAGAGKEKC